MSCRKGSEQGASAQSDSTPAPGGTLNATLTALPGRPPSQQLWAPGPAGVTLGAAPSPPVHVPDGDSGVLTRGTETLMVPKSMIMF